MNKFGENRWRNMGNVNAWGKEESPGYIQGSSDKSRVNWTITSRRWQERSGGWNRDELRFRIVVAYRGFGRRGCSTVLRIDFELRLDPLVLIVGYQGL
jgi:hypothetical protein